MTLKNIIQSCLIISAGLLSACESSTSSSNTFDEASKQSAHSTSPPSSAVTDAPQGSNSPHSCPSKSFEAFLTAFANDIEIQKRFVARPLQSEFIDSSAEPEPKLVSEALHLGDLHFPLIPSPEKQAIDRLDLETRSLDDRRAEVVAFKNDTDYKMTFYFEMVDGCWLLAQMKNDSL